MTAPYTPEKIPSRESDPTQQALERLATNPGLRRGVRPVVSLLARLRGSALDIGDRLDSHMEGVKERTEEKKKIADQELAASRKVFQSTHQEVKQLREKRMVEDLIAGERHIY